MDYGKSIRYLLAQDILSPLEIFKFSCQNNSVIRSRGLDEFGYIDIESVKNLVDENTEIV